MIVSDVGPITASDDLFITLRRLEKRAQQKIPNMPFLFPEKGSGVLEKIFGGLSKAKGKWLLGAFAVWIVKTVLAGAGLMMATDVLKQKVAPTIEQHLPQNPFNSASNTQQNQEEQTQVATVKNPSV